MECKLSQTFVAKLRDSAEREEYRDTVTTGLSVRTGKSGSFYYVRYAVRIHGERVRRAMKLASCGVVSLAEARDMAKSILARVALGEDPAADKEEERTTMDQWSIDRFCAEQYMPWFRRERRSADSVRGPLFIEIRAIGKDVRICDLTPAHIERARATQRQTGIKNCTLGQREEFLRKALEWGVKGQLLTRNPMRDIELVPKNDAAEVVRYLTKDEERRLFEALRERDGAYRRKPPQRRRERPIYPNGHYADCLEPMIVTALKTGIRKGALAALKWSDIDFSLRQVTVRAEICKTNRTRHIPLCPSAYECLRLWKETVRPESEDRLVFSERGSMSMDTLDKDWWRVLKMSGIKNFRWHDMRHTFASNLVMAGVDLNTVRELMGHASIRMTLRYAHLAPEVKANAVAKLG